MPTPIAELIAQELVARLELILVENGYAIDVAEVIRPRRDGSNWRYKNYGIGVVLVSDDINDELSYPGNPPAVASVLTFNLHCIVRDSAKDKLPRAVSEQEIVACVKKAVTDDGNDWYSMGGNAIDSNFGSAEPFTSPDGELCGVTVPFYVTYRYSETDPYTVRA